MTALSIYKLESACRYAPENGFVYTAPYRPTSQPPLGTCFDSLTDVQPSLQKLIDLVQRDFIGYWYDQSVALSPNTPFPKYTRSMLNCIINNLVDRIKQQDPKEVSIYLFHSLSNAVITQLRQEDEEIMPEQLRSDKDILIRKVRRTSEEVCSFRATTSLAS